MCRKLAQPYGQGRKEQLVQRVGAALLPYGAPSVVVAKAREVLQSVRRMMAVEAKLLGVRHTDAWHRAPELRELLVQASECGITANNPVCAPRPVPAPPPPRQRPLLRVRSPRRAAGGARRPAHQGARGAVA
eukprot:3364953-Prymnesium_polylepis.1